MLRVYGLLFLLAIAFAACGPAVLSPAAAPTEIPPPPAGVLSVEPSAGLGPISPYFLGSNYGPWVAVPADMLEEAYAAGVKAIRFPGGAWGDQNNLKPYQIDAFMDFCRKMGAIPTISVRLREGDPQAAAGLVRYANIEKQYGVVYWSIGNEPTLFADELRAKGVEDYDTVRYNREWRAMALAMREVDAGIKLMGPEIHQFNYDANFNPKDSSGRDWMIEFLKANGDLVDVVAFHRYPLPKSYSDPAGSIEDLRQNSQEWEKTIRYLRGLIGEHTGRDIPIAVTEVNSHWTKSIGGEATPDSHYNAVWLADMLGRLMRQGVFMVNHWMLSSQGGQGGWGLIGRGELRPSYYVYRLYNMFGNRMVHAASGVEDVEIFAASREDGALTLMIVNRGDAEAQGRLHVQGKAPSQAELWLLDPDHHGEDMGVIAFPEDGALRLPGQSVSLLVLVP